MLLSEKNGSMPIKLYIMEAKTAMVPTVNVIAVAPAPEEEPQIINVVVEDENEEEAAPIPEQEEPPTGEKEQPLEDMLGFEMIEDNQTERPLIPANDNFEGWLDMDVCVFFDRLRHQACSLLDPTENEALKKGKDFLHSLVPDENPPVVRDLIDVVDSVKQAFQDGYTNLKELPELKEFVTMISSLSSPGNDAPAQKKKPCQWLNQLATLQSMGFTDTETNQALLVKYRGNVQKVVDVLLPEPN
jgi:hypothetical protein